MSRRRRSPAGGALAVGAGFLGASPPGDPWHATPFIPVPEDVAATIAREALAAPAGADASGLRGFLEIVADGSALGWVYDPALPRRRLALEVLVDGETVAETVADLPRTSLEQEGIGDGRHGFVVALPPRLCDGETHEISLRTPGGAPLAFARAFTTTASRIPEWGATTFVEEVAERPSAAPAGSARSARSAPHPGSVGQASAEPAAKTTATALATGTLSLRSRDELQLSRAASQERLTARADPETLVLAAEMDVELSDPLHFAVQPGVADPLAERRLRFDGPRRYSVPRSLVSRLPRGIVDTTSFLTMPSEWEYLLDSVRHPGALLRWGYERLPDGVLEREAVEITEREERVVVLGAQSNRNYSHWLLESLARALLFAPLDDGTWRYLTPPLTVWQRQTLELVGVDSERILEVEKEGPVRFREVVAVSRGMGGLPAIRPAAVAALAALAAPNPGRRRLYCSREATRHRHVENEAELVELLARHGFESVVPERLGIAEQIELFAGAEVVFALHGSALTNIAFCRPGTLVIELQAEGFNYGGVVWNWILASLRDQPFVQVVCPLSEATADLPHASRDVTVDLDHLDALLYRVLAG